VSLNRGVILQEIKKALSSVVDNIQRTGKLDIAHFVQYMEPIFNSRGFRQKTKDTIESILVIRLDEIGDNILTSGFLRELRRNYPQAHITLVVNKTVYTLVKYCPYVNEIHSYQGSHQGNFIERFTWAMELCEQFLWEKHFSLCFLPRWDFDRYFSLFLAYISGAVERIGYSEKLYQNKAKANAGFDMFLTKPIVNPKSIIHEAERNYFLLQAVGLTIQNKSLELWYNQQDFIMAQKLVETYINKKIIAVALGANESNKIYPKEMYLEAFKIIQQDENIVFILLGGPADYDTNEYIISRLNKKKAINLAGKTNLRQSCAVMSMAAMYIGNDTGVKHMAAALHIPVIEINREAQDCPKTILSLYERFFPWNTPTISLRPQQAIGKCHEMLSQGGCIEPQPHCIRQIKPIQIAEAYKLMQQVTYK